MYNVYTMPLGNIDNDGNLGLYLAKCSMFAIGPANTDVPCRINQLFINHTYDRINGQLVKSTTNFSNDPTNWFSEAVAREIIKISGQSWTVDFADIDNDGDQDLLEPTTKAQPCCWKTMVQGILPTSPPRATLPMYWSRYRG